MTTPAPTAAAAQAAYLAGSDLAAAKRRLGEALPEDGWLGDYLRAVVPFTDAPVEFHLASGLGVLAAATGNRRWRISWGDVTVYPNLWVVLVAPSSFWRKSTSISLAERLLRDSDPKAVLPSDFSRERFLEILADRADGLLSLKEFGAFLAALGRDYMGGMKETLTELYDGPSEYTRALKSGVITVRNPALTILAATTLDWLESRISDGDLAGGFLGRFLFVTATEKASPKGLTDAMDFGVRNRLVAQLHRLSDRPSEEVRVEPAARDLLDEWMAGWEAEVGREHHASDLTGFAVRLQTYALKLSMLYRVSWCLDSDEDDRVVDERSVSRAIAYCRVLWRNVTELVDERVAISREARELRRIRGIIGEGCTRSDALKRSKLKARDFDQYLDTLVQSGQVSSVSRKASEVGLERSKDRAIQWLSVLRDGASKVIQFPDPVSAGDALASLSVHANGEGTERTGNREGTERPEPSTNLSLTSLSLTSPTHDLDTDTYARGKREPRTETPDPTVGLPVEDLDEGGDEAPLVEGPEL